MTMLYQLSLTEMLAAIEAGQCTAEEIWQSCAEHIDRHEPRVHAWQQLATHADMIDLPPSASSAARVLKGLPIGVKDTIDVVGFGAERGSPVWKGRKPDADASCVSLLKLAGARVMGKTVTTEFAYFSPGATRNPHQLEHTPGGSSSGSAAAVAAGMVPLAIGSQTAASVIRPAAYCGVVGYVASAGMVSLRGVMPLAHTLDALGVLARDVADIQLVQRLFARGEAAADMSERKPKAVLAIDGTAFGHVEPEMRACYASAVEALRAQDVQVDQASDTWLASEEGQALFRWHGELMAYEAAQTLAFEYGWHRDKLTPTLQALIEQGMRLSGEQYDALKFARDAALGQFAQLMSRYDAILAPSAPGGAPKGLAATGRPDQSRVWQLLGAPQISLPVGKNGEGLPLGLQIIGRPRGDAELLRIARWLQDKLAWRGHLPEAFN